MISFTEKSWLKKLLIVTAITGLILTIGPPVLHWQGIMLAERVNGLMLAGTIIWFASASFIFMKKDSPR
jgi:hypothetical protein